MCPEVPDSKKEMKKFIILSIIYIYVPTFAKNKETP